MEKHKEVRGFFKADRQISGEVHIFLKKHLTSPRRGVTIKTQTVDAEITSDKDGTESPGGCDPGATPFGKWTAEGAVKGASAPSILQRMARVSCPGICRYPARARFWGANQGGTADNVAYSSLTLLVEGDFLFVKGECCNK